jgi:signal transduction histidine kinase
MNAGQTFNSFHSVVVRYGAAALLTLSALIVTLLIWSLVQSLASPLFLAAISISAWKKGFDREFSLRCFRVLLLITSLLLPNMVLAALYRNHASLYFCFGRSRFMLAYFGEDLAVEEIQSSREQLLALSVYQQTLLEEERKRIALEIHDELGQSLTGMKIELHMLNRK